MTQPTERPATPVEYETLTRRASLINEMDILREMGERGWELTGIGLGALHFRRDPERVQRWEYLRTSGTVSDDAMKELETQNWQYTASWMINAYNYFKRSLDRA